MTLPSGIKTQMIPSRHQTADPRQVPTLTLESGSKVVPDVWSKRGAEEDMIAELTEVRSHEKDC